MKKKLASVAIMATALASMATSSFAAFSSVQVAVVAATATVGGVALVRFDAPVIKAASNPFAVTTYSKIGWTNASPDSGWKMADQCIVLRSTVTNVAGGIQLYTNNTSVPGTIASPKYVDPTPDINNDSDANPAGLILRSGAATTGLALPMAWSIHGSSVVPNQAGATGILAANPNSNGLNGNPTDNNAFQWIFFTDKATPVIDRGNGITTPAFVNGDQSVQLLSYSSIHGTQGPSGFFTLPDGVPTFIYMQADFSGAAVGQQFLTDTITIEGYTL